MKEKLLRVDQAAKALNCSRRTIYRLITDCEIDALKIRKTLRITHESVDLFIRRQISAYQEDNGVRIV